MALAGVLSGLAFFFLVWLWGVFSFLLYLLSGLWQLKQKERVLEFERGAMAHVFWAFALIAF